MGDPEVHANIGIEMDSIEEAELDSSRSKRNGTSLCVSFKEDTVLVSGADPDSSPVEPKSLEDELEDNTDTSLYRQRAFKIHGKRRDLPGSIYHTLRFTDNWREVIRWLDSKERRQHVDDYKCKSYISFTESVGNLTALHLACLYNRPKAVQYLLEAGADVSLKDDLGRSALHCLCASESEKSIFEAFKMIKEKILEKPFAIIHELVNGREKKTGRTPIMEACLQGRGSAIFSLCKSGLNADVQMRDYEEVTALHYLCVSQVDSIDPRALSVMIQMSDVHSRDKQGRTPFLVACENNKPDVAKRLLDAGTDLYVQDNDERSALHYLSASENANITELLGIISKRVAEKARFSRELGGFESPDSVELLSFTDGPVATAREFINKTDSHGMTPLQIALKKENIENAKILIANGANIDMRLEDERLPLQFACDNVKPYVDLAIVLVNYGADTTIRLDEGGFNNYSCSLLHFACREDYMELVDCLLQNGADVMDRDTENKRPFYYVQSYSVHKLLVKAGGIDTRDRHPKLLDESCRKGLSEKAIYLIEHVKEVKPKHLKDAIKYNYQSICMAIIKHPNWYKFLRHTYYGDRGEETTPFRELTKKMPDVAEVVLNKCMVSDPKFKDPGDSNYSVIMNYEFLEDFSLSQKDDLEESEVIRPYSTLKENSEFAAGHDCSYKALSDVKQECFSTTWGPTVFSKHNHPLSIMVHHGRMNLLSHPLVSSLLHHKWSKFGRYGYYGNVILYCIFLCFLTAYALSLPKPISKRDRTMDDQNCTQTGPDNCGFSHRPFLYIAAVVIIIMCLFRILFATFRLITDCSYSTVFFWLLKLPLSLFSIVFASFFHDPCACLPNCQWQIGIMATFLGWVNLVFIISKFPLIGIYIIMLTRVFYTFLKVVLLTFLLVIAFGMAFFMAFHSPKEKRSPFSTFEKSVVKTITMTTGEFDFDDIFLQSPRPGDVSEDDDEIQFMSVSYLLWIIFVIVMPVLLTNMLVGLAVGDIDKIQKGAALKKLALQVDLVLAVETTLRRRPFNRILTVAWRKVCPNRRLSSKNTHKLDMFNWRKSRHYAEELWDQLQFAEWGGGRYDVTVCAKSDISEGPCACGRTRSLDDEIEKINLQLQAQSRALDHVVKRSQEDLKQALNLLAALAQRDHEGGPEINQVAELLESFRCQQGAEELRERRHK